MTKGTCPLCGSKLLDKKGDVLFPLKRRTITVKNIEYLECASCHEKLFGHETQRIIENTAYRRTKKSAA